MTRHREMYEAHRLQINVNVSCALAGAVRLRLCIDIQHWLSWLGCSEIAAQCIQSRGASFFSLIQSAERQSRKRILHCDVTVFTIFFAIISYTWVMGTF